MILLSLTAGLITGGDLMDMRALQNLISKEKESLINLANRKKNPLCDPEVYRKSCQLDCLVVKYTKLAMKRG